MRIGAPDDALSPSAQLPAQNAKISSFAAPPAEGGYSVVMEFGSLAAVRLVQQALSLGPAWE